MIFFSGKEAQNIYLLWVTPQSRKVSISVNLGWQSDQLEISFSKHGQLYNLSQGCQKYFHHNLQQQQDISWLLWKMEYCPQKKGALTPKECHMHEALS